MAADSERMPSRDEVRRSPVVDSDRHAMSDDAGTHPRRRRRNRPNASFCSNGAADEQPADSVGPTTATGLEAREVAQAIIRWYAIQKSATKERVIELQHWLRRLRGAAAEESRKDIVDKTKALIEKYGG
jgi:hypothetical protein